MEGIQELINNLNSDNERERAFAAEDIAYDGLVEGISYLVRRLRIEPSRFVREVIVNSLKTMKGTELIENVIPLLRSDDAFIRNAGIDILSARGEDAIEAIRKLLGDPDKDVRKFAMDVLFQLNDIYSADMIAEALHDPDVNNIITAVEYLGKLEASAHSPEIAELLKNTSNLLLKCTCLEALAIIGDEHSIHTVADVYTDYQSMSSLEQYSYLKFIAAKGTEIHFELIVSLIKEKGELMHKEIINALEGILTRFDRDMLPQFLLNALELYMETGLNEINQYELLVLLGEFKNEEIYPLLVKYSQYTNKMSYMGAIEGLGLYGNKEAIPLLESLKVLIADEEVLDNIHRSIEMLKTR